MDSVIASVGRTRRLVICDETFAMASVADHLANAVYARAGDQIAAFPRSLTSAHATIPFSPHPPGESPMVGQIEEAARDLCRPN